MLSSTPGRVDHTATDFSHVLSSLIRDRGEALARGARFVPGDHYHRECIHTAAGFEVWLLSWLPGQITPIHDHGGILTVTTVLTGKVFEERFERTGAGLTVRPTWTTTRTAGDIDPIDLLEIHRVRPLVPSLTLHLYAPCSVDGTIYEAQLS
ncbi:MAG TPA: cysteine dioxygenase family protein [Kofleriaceae bacterium]|nr:cysteine dioxygenase family protein [Kofleriaceae bacterium]